MMPHTPSIGGLLQATAEGSITFGNQEQQSGAGCRINCLCNPYSRSTISS
jgi:hypothetical protein